MNNQYTQYRAKGKSIGFELLFKYDLNGNLKAFEIQEGELSETQQLWLFDPLHFPSNEEKMKYWSKSAAFLKKFEVTIAPADLSFEALWKLYDHKHARFHAIKTFEKQQEATKIKIFTSIPEYKKYITKTGISQAHLATYINGQYYDNEYKK